MNLPSGIRVEKIVRDGKIAYSILTKEGLELGGLVVSGTPDGDTHLEPYISDDKTSYSQNDKERLVADVSRQMTDALIQYEASKPEHFRKEVTPPTNLPDGVQALENQYIPCSKCNSILARLIFSWDSATKTELVDMGEKFIFECSSIDYPVWILGAPNSQDDRVAEHLTLQLAAEIGKVYWEHPDDMNERLVSLDDHHC